MILRDPSLLAAISSAVGIVIILHGAHKPSSQHFIHHHYYKIAPPAHPNCMIRPVWSVPKRTTGKDGEYQVNVNSGVLYHKVLGSWISIKPVFVSMPKKGGHQNSSVSTFRY